MNRSFPIAVLIAAFVTWSEIPTAVAQAPNARAAALARTLGTTGKPSRSVDSFKGTVVIAAGSLWNSPVRFGEQCSFDVELAFNDTFTTTDYGDRVLIQIEIADIYTNVATGFSFLDWARYSIVLDKATGHARHDGVFWRVNVQGKGVVVHDVGQFTQDWSTVPPPLAPVIEMHGTHDVNSLPFGTLSYCNWAQGIFP